MFQGYRTYLTVTLIVIVQAAGSVDVFDAKTVILMTNLLLGGGLAFLRAGVANK